MDRETAEVFELLTNLALKVLVVVVLLLTWISLVVCMIIKPGLYLGMVTGIASFSFSPLFKHFLPTVRAAVKRKPAAKPLPEQTAKKLPDKPEL